MSTRISNWMVEHPRLVLATFGILTLLFAVANIALDNQSEASQEPDAAVFDARDIISERLEPTTHAQFMLVEAVGGDILTAAPLAELHANSNAVRQADREGGLSPDDIERQPLLADEFSSAAGRRVSGFLTIADAVANGVEANFGIKLADASDDMVKLVLADLLEDPATASLSNQISVQATRTQQTVLGREVTVVEAPAIMFEVVASNRALGGGQFAIGPSADPLIHRKEAFNLNLQDGFRGAQTHIEVLAVAAAANETSNEQGRTAAPFIVLAAIAAVVTIGFALRSYWATALTGVGLAILMTWLGGISNLIGLKGGLVIELLVPISMIALGVDFAVHSMAHYQHDRRSMGSSAFRLGFAGVFGALTLAAATDSVAFLSNASSGIESIRHFGIAAAVGTVSSFLVLGVVAPFVLSLIDTNLEQPHRVGRLPVLSTIRVAASTGAATIVTLAVSPLAGFLLTGLVIVVNLVGPFRYAKRTLGSENASTERLPSKRAEHAMGQIVRQTAAHPVALLAATAAITGAALFGASGLKGSFDISDFFSPDTDFVQSIERLPQHVGDRGGEANQILIEGDLSEPATWSAIQQFADSLNDNTALATSPGGSVMTSDPQPIRLLAGLFDQADVIEDFTGVRLIDADSDGIPDTPDQLAAAWKFATTAGVSAPDGSTLFTAEEIRSVINFDGRADDLTMFGVEVPDPGNFANVELARDQLLADSQSLEKSAAIVSVTATGSGLGRLEVISASTDALRTSLPVAIVVVFLVLLIGLRSTRLAVVTTIPMLLVASWLYGIMALFGFDLNLVTATIGAISIGVGADYSLHMTKRYLHARGEASSHLEAVRQAAESTGVALLASAGSTAIGFAILSFAPMPLFATFGLLTAIMVIFALLAAVIVLPTLLGFALTDNVSLTAASEVDASISSKAQPVG